MNAYVADAAGARWPEGSNRRILHAFGLAAAYQVALVGSMAVGVPLLLGDGDPFEAPPPAFALVAIIAVLQAGLVVTVGLGRWGRVSPRDLGWRVDDLGNDLLKGILGFALVTMAILFVESMTGGMTPDQIWSKVRGYTVAQRALFVYVGVVAGFGEESIFRGYLQPALVRRWGLIGGVLATASIFSVYHLQFQPVRLATLLLIGLVYGALRGRDGSLVAPAIAHGLCWAMMGSL